MKKTYYTVNNKGDIGCHDCDYATAKENLDYNMANYPNEEWELFDSDDEEE